MTDQTVRWQRATKLAQAGNRSNPATGALNPPVYFSTTFQHPELGASTGYDYSRTQNPTREIVEKVLAELEQGVKAFATSSGMSAIQLIFSLFKADDHIVASRDLYGGSYRFFAALEEKGQAHFSYADEEADFEALIQPNTVALFVETPTNPLMNEVSIEQLAALAKKNNLLLIVDNTFYTPLLQQPLTLGADLVIHSATKYLGGHNDLLAGVVVAQSPELAEKLTYYHNTTGACLAPFDCWLLLRGLKTLALRLERQQANAQELVTYLQQVPFIKNVYYPGKGAMVSFTLGEAARVAPLLKALSLVTFAESLGGVETLITYPTTQTHADIPKALRESYGLTADLLRVSVGIEAIEDLIADFDQAFRTLE